MGNALGMDVELCGLERGEKGRKGEYTWCGRWSSEGGISRIGVRGEYVVSFAVCRGRGKRPLRGESRAKSM